MAGSTATGVRVAQAAATDVTGSRWSWAARARRSSYADADLDAAAKGLVAGVFAATGQTCIAGSRLIVHADVHDALVEKVAARAHAIRLGDPTAAETGMGPVADQPQHEKVLGHLRDAQADGGTFACGVRRRPSS